MPYQVPGNDPLSPQRRRLSRFRINPFFIHLTLVIIILLVFFFYLTPDSKTNLDKTQEVQFVGELENFNISHKGNLELYSTEFTLETPNAKFDEGAKNFQIENFTGTIHHFNKTIITQGTAKSIQFGKNSLNLNNENFKLTSKKKTTVDIYFQNLTLTFKEGRIKVSDILNYELDNSTINLKNFNTSITYDGTYSINGEIEKFDIQTQKQGITISYNQNE